MKSDIIDSYIKKQRQELNDTSLGRKIQESLSQNRLSLELFPTIEPIFIILHTMNANFQPEQGFHTHDFFEIFYIYRGTATQYTPDSTVQYKEGHACLMNTDFSHGISIPSEDSVVFNILISREAINGSFLNLLSENDPFSRFFLNSLFSKTVPGECISFEVIDGSRNEILMKALLEEYILHRPCCLAAMQCYLSLIFTELLRDQIYTAEKENLQDTNLTEILTYISNHLKDISLNNLAEHFHYDAAYLSKMLKKYFGKTFSSLVSEMRVSRAAAYLLNDDISIDAIVEQLGYYDRSYFNRVFRKKYGCSPQEYRRNKENASIRF